MSQLDDYQSLIEGRGLKCRRSGRYLVAQCLSHDERNPSMQVFEDGWCNCLAGCGRFHLAKFFPHLRETPDAQGKIFVQKPTPKPVAPRPAPPRNFQDYELYPEWEKMPLIPRDHVFKGLPLQVLDDLGWRWTDGIAGMRAGYFIPYFNAKRDSIKFAQVRHLSGDRRFTFLPGAKQNVYGAWNLVNPILFLVEGTSDGAVLEHCMIPWIALPSASSIELVKELAKFCLKNGTRIVYAGDKDVAGHALLVALDGTSGYRLRQPPKTYKDWGEFYEAEGILAVYEYCQPEIEL